MEGRDLPRFERVYVCSEPDRAELAREHGAGRVAVIPNAVRIPPAAPARRADAPFTLLFVGTLGYYPNEDAALFLCTEVLPRLRARARRPFRVHIVGPHPPRRVRALAAHPEVRVIGPVADIAAAYRDADVAVVPVRAGGGTRIKVLEAFSYRRPVVATTSGAEGIDALPETHFLHADTPEGFAARCLRLMEDASVGRALAERAFDLVRTRYSPQQVLTLLRRDHRGADAR
jgi:glycosyltransferase involved in cell wall biosynthesis